MRHVFWAALCVAVCFVSSVSAQNIDDYLTVSPTPNWVTPQTRPQTAFALAENRGVNYLLVDKQYRQSRDTSERFVHYVDELLSPEAVENNATITIDFDPAYQSVDFHYMRRIRDGVATDILDPSLFDVYRIETQRDLLIYNGTLQLAYLIPDVRVGDLLDYAFTIKGRNPAVGPHHAGGFQHQYGVPVQHQYQRLLVPSDTVLNMADLGTSFAPQITQLDEWTEYLWEIRDNPAVFFDDNLPNSYFPFGTTQFSTYANWADLGTTFAPYYDVANLQSDAVRQIADDIRAAHQTPKTQVRAALDFVQQEVRYLGIELGTGGYIPRQPDVVLRNRFGDCKDMTLLLIAILAELDIKAQPFLVNSDLRDAVSALVPAASAFDHVITSVDVAGETYFLDPTRGPQLGDLDHLQQGHFGSGVIVAADGPGLVAAPVPLPEYWKDITDVYDVVAEPDVIGLTTTSTYHMSEADRILAWYDREGANAVSRAFLKFYQNDFPQIEEVSPLEISVDDVHAVVTLRATYRIPDAWSEGQTPDEKKFWTRANDVLIDLPDFVGASRTMPYALADPVRTKQTLRFILNDEWDIDPSNLVITEPGFEFSQSEQYFSHIFTRIVSYRSTAHSLAAGDFSRTMAAIRDARDSFGVTLIYNTAIAEKPRFPWLADIFTRP